MEAIIKPFKRASARLILPVLLGAFILLLDSCVVVKPAPGPPPGNARGRSEGGPPPWAPAHGYRAKTRYVFFPTIGIYYDLQRESYMYLDGGKWITAKTLPTAYSGYNLKKLKQEELDEGIHPEAHHANKNRGGNNTAEKEKKQSGNGKAAAQQGPPADKGKGKPPGKGNR